MNLLSNAVKYTPEGGTIHFTIRELPYEREGYALFQTVVEDTGIGISKEYIPHLFEAFSREKKFIRKRYYRNRTWPSDC
ncbi:MAG: ATP-binding protein [Anaerobutyricum hallii]